jgi:hypothetical protein
LCYSIVQLLRELVYHKPRAAFHYEQVVICTYFCKG